ncbi:MAG: hypothetical protein LBR73_04470 [Oscillospiraceae bacterium]|nr:hypothetical protein [Oscillospiraceae bacterium]
MKIIIIGAGVAGLALAGQLDSAKHEVAVYERDTEEVFAGKYGWYDNINCNDLAKIGFAHLIPRKFPEEEDRILTGPSKTTRAVFRISAEGEYEPIWRPTLLGQLKADAVQHAAITYGKPVRSLLIENNKVLGVETSDGEEEADLVVDCAGLTGLNQTLLEPGMLRHRASEYFTAYRAVYKHTPKGPAPGMDNIILKHCGEMGVGWYNVDPDGNIDILLGRLGQLRKETIQKSLSDIQAWSASWSELGELIQAGVYTIPVRYPLLQMVFDGYAAVGDSAYMTIPMMGSGVVNAIHGAKLLAKLLNAQDAKTTEALWPYQVQYFKKAVGDAFAIDILKRTALGLSNEKVDALLGAGLLSAADIASIFTGHFISLKPLDLIAKVPGGVKVPLIVAEIAAAIARALAAAQLAKLIPATYDRRIVGVWQRNLAKLVRNA